MPWLLPFAKTVSVRPWAFSELKGASAFRMASILRRSATSFFCRTCQRPTEAPMWARSRYRLPRQKNIKLENGLLAMRGARANGGKPQRKITIRRGRCVKCGCIRYNGSVTGQHIQRRAIQAVTMRVCTRHIHNRRPFTEGALAFDHEEIFELDIGEPLFICCLISVQIFYNGIRLRFI